MREIKYRLWCNNKKEWEKDEWHLTSDGLIIDTRRNIKMKKETHFLNQFTGLFDKQGVEIYEGDIVKCPLGIGYIDYIESYFRRFRPFVFSTNLCNETNSNDLDAKNKVEVIGNIYENKELLI